MNPIIELLLINLPLKRVFDLNTFKILPIDLSKVTKLPAQLEKLIKELLNGSLPATPDINYNDAEQFIEQLKYLTGTALTSNLIKSLDDQGLDGVAISQKLSDLITLAQQVLPPKNPTKSQLTRFTWVLNILDNPFYILNLMSNQLLTSIDVKTVKIAYPITYEIITTNLVKAIIENNVELTRPKKMMLGILLEQPTITMQVLMAYISSAQSNQPANLNVSRLGA